MGRGEPEAPLSGGWKAPAPPPDALVAWPESFGTRFLLCVDTEEEFDWARGFDRDARATSHMAALPEMHARFAGQGVPVTYLVDHPIATAPEAVAVLRRLLEDGRSAVGTQLHPWVNPPFAEPVNGYNSFAGNLSRELEAAKIATLTDVIAGAFGARPLVYRAGRYGLGPDSLATLAALGYRADSSMRSGYDYSREGGPDFRAVPNHAFHTGPARSIVELPLTTGFIGHARRGGARLYDLLGRIPRGRGIASRSGMLSRVALSPEDMPVAEACEAVRVLVGEGVRLLNFSFHSPSIVPGHTPYVRDQADLAAFRHWWDAMLALLGMLGVEPASIAEVIDAACDPARGSANAVSLGACSSTVRAGRS